MPWGVIGEGGGGGGGGGGEPCTSQETLCAWDIGRPSSLTIPGNTLDYSYTNQLIHSNRFINILEQSH